MSARGCGKQQPHTAVGHFTKGLGCGLLPQPHPTYVMQSRNLHVPRNTTNPTTPDVPSRYHSPSDSLRTSKPAPPSSIPLQPVSSTLLQPPSGRTTRNLNPNNARYLVVPEIHLPSFIRTRLLSRNIAHHLCAPGNLAVQGRLAHAVYPTHILRAELERELG